ncbi:hypothetical protein D3C75_1254410 [compost metagenome]
MNVENSVSQATATQAWVLAGTSIKPNGKPVAVSNTSVAVDCRNSGISKPSLLWSVSRTDCRRW